MKGPKKVAVIGGGCSGVITTRMLRDAGHRPTMFESAGSVGGIWSPDPAHEVTYKGLLTNIPTAVMQSPDLAFPPGLPSFVGRADLGRYVVDYATKFGVMEHARMGCHVTSVAPTRTEEEEQAGESGWLVQWAGGHDSFDAVVVANGHHSTPYRPKLAGQEEWLAASGSRRLIHARDYDDPHEFESQCVLVVGSESSGSDIARELRSLVPRLYVLCGSYGSEVFTEGNCTHVPLGTVLQADGRLSTAGRVVEGPPVESVVMATGYLYDFPFLDAKQLGLSFGPDGRYVSPLYQHVLHVRRPSLAFVGIPKFVPFPIRVFEAQARFVAARFREQVETAAQMEAWVSECWEAVGDRSQDLHQLRAAAFPYVLELATLAGVAGDEYDRLCQANGVLAGVIGDITKRMFQDRRPWSDDSFRRCTYSVDLEAGTWSVTSSKL